MTQLTITKEITDKALTDAIANSIACHDLMDDDAFNEYVFDMAKPMVQQILKDNQELIKQKVQTAIAESLDGIISDVLSGM